MRWSYLFWLVVLAGAAATLFEIKHEVQALEEELLMTERRIRNERETIEVLRAEWSFLNQPARIERLAREHLGLVPLSPDQIVRVDRLPPRPEDFARVPVDLDTLLPPSRPERLPGPGVTPVSETTQ
jgi:cell division protein FtsL